MKSDRRAEREPAFFDGLEGGAKNREFNQARAGERKIAVYGGDLAAAEIFDDVADGAAELIGALADGIGQRLPIIGINGNPGT